MSMKVNAGQGDTPVQGTQNMESAYRSLVSSCQQKLFQSVLNQAQAAGQDQGKEEINSLQQELTSLQKSATKGQNADPTALRRTDLNGVPASALLKLAVMSPSRGASPVSRYGGISGAAGSAAAAAPDRLATGGPSGQQKTSESNGLGSLSASFESGSAGVEAIGYDEGGGTSYGLYQISSRAGTMKRFVEYLQDHAPKLAARLRSAGQLDTGSTKGGVPREWKKIAGEDPDQFALLQHDFIEQTHYLPAVEEIYQRTGIDMEKQSKTLQEVLWSTAVQHGPRGAANIFSKAVDKGQLNSKDLPVQKMISSIYSSRAKQFGSSTSGVRASVWRRFEEEKSMALAMLANEARRTSAVA